jgi:hypothetical protein
MQARLETWRLSIRLVGTTREPVASAMGEMTLQLPKGTSMTARRMCRANPLNIPACLVFGLAAVPAQQARPERIRRPGDRTGFFEPACRFGHRADGFREDFESTAVFPVGAAFPVLPATPTSPIP